MTNRFFPHLLGRPSLRLARSDLAPRGRSRPRALGALAALALAAAPTMLAPTLASADPTCTTSGSTTTCIFSSTGSEQTFTVPAGVSSVTVTAVRDLVLGTPATTDVLQALAWMAGIILVFAPFAVRLYRRAV